MRATLRKEQIMDAATAAFSDLGFQNTSISVVCDRAGIARGTLYQYFDDKQTLFREVIESYAERLSDLMASPTLEEFAKEGATEIMRRRLELIYSEVIAHKAVYNILFNEARAAGAETRDLAQAIQRRLSDQLATTIAFAVQARVADVPDPRFAAEFIIGAVFRIAETHILEAEPSLPAAELAEKTTELAARAAQLTLNPMQGVFS